MIPTVRACTRLTPHFMGRNIADILDSLLDLHFPTYFTTSIWDDKSVHTQNMQGYLLFLLGNVIFSLHSSPNRFMYSKHSLSLLGLAYEGWKENFCPGLQFTFVGLDLCRSAMLQALWPWLLLLPTFTKLWLKHHLLSFPSDESCKLRTGLMKLIWK